MQPGALAPYENALRAAAPLALHDSAGRRISLDVRRWLGAADDGDRTVLERCVGPTLDVGCGPGRFVAALAERGSIALGVDIAEQAIRLIRRRGLAGVRRDVFTPLPADGHWRTVLLMDGNIGIGGDPRRLLTRCHELLVPGGCVLVEADVDHTMDEALQVRFAQHGEEVGPVFPWARVGRRALIDYGWDAGLTPVETWTSHGRCFVSLRRSVRDG